MSQANVSYKDVLSQLSSLDKVIVRKEFALVFASQMKTSKYMYPFCNKMTSHTTEEKIPLRDRRTDSGPVESFSNFDH